MYKLTKFGMSILNKNGIQKNLFHPILMTNNAINKYDNYVTMLK